MQSMTLLTILAMAVVTYLTRVAGFLVLRNRSFTPTTQAVMNAAPGCVLIAVIAPKFVSDQPADLLALAITLVLATRLPLLPTVLLSVVITGVLRNVVMS